jgi:small subunit ribosomal protein S13
MIRLLGVELNNKKAIFISLTKIYGIGISLSKKILNNLNINIFQKTNNLDNNDFLKLKNILESKNFKVEGDLKRFNDFNIKRLININCYRGKRYLKGLPVNGQRTRTNSKTSRKFKK